MKQVKVGIISLAHMHSYGYADTVYCHDRAVLAGVYDEDPERGMAAAKRWGTVYFDSLPPLLEAVDAAIICSDNRSHYRYAQEAALQGVHILVEKPITTSGEEARELIRLCRELGLLVMTAFPVRLSASIQAVKEQVDRGDIGDIIAIAATNHGKMPGGWFIDPERAGGGAVLDHTVHVADILRWLMASEAEEVYAEAGAALHDLAVEDCGLLSIRYANGVFATLDTSWSRPASYPRWGSVSLRIVGTRGAIHAETSAHAGQMWRDQAEWAHAYVGAGETANALLIDEFIDCVITGRQPLITGEDGLRAAELAWAAYESSRSGQPVPVRSY